MPRVSATITEDMYAAIVAYKAAHGYKSIAETCTALLVIALEAETGEPLEMPDLAHGGWRGNPKSLENLIHYVDELTDKGRNEP